jgi:7-carboxy-7-deazaguanine synthase
LTLNVNEIFYSIQGESSFSGIPCIFIRLTGCNLRCSYCDTRYACDEGTVLSLDEVLRRIALFPCSLVEVTGGEPLLQQNTPKLLRILLHLGYKVLVETNGSMNIEAIDKRCIRIVDIKCPSSGEADMNDLGNLKRLTGKDELKFVIGCRSDYEFAKDLVLSPEIMNLKIKPPLFSPVMNKLKPKRLAAWILEDHLNVRLQVQLHKVIWGNRRGV